MGKEELAPFACKLVCTAEEEGVTVVVPRQETGVKVEVVKLPLRTLEELQSENDDFTPTRLVINFEVRDAETDDPLRTFDPAIELQVAYTAEDVENAGGLENLVLGFWPEEQERPEEEQERREDEEGRWIAFTEAKHGFRLEGDTEGGVGFATVSSWGDAHIGAGD